MAYIVDSTQSFTITLTALLEGVGILSWITVTNDTTLIAGEWDGITWISPIPAVTEGDSINVYIEVENTGVTTDTLFAEFISGNVTVTPTLYELPNVPVAGVADTSWSFTMPPNDVNITINAGHVE